MDTTGARHWCLASKSRRAAWGWSFVALKPQRSIWLMLTNEVPESTIAAVL